MIRVLVLRITWILFQFCATPWVHRYKMETELSQRGGKSLLTSHTVLKRSSVQTCTYYIQQVYNKDVQRMKYICWFDQTPPNALKVENALGVS